jgi:hypothetical protein
MRRVVAAVDFPPPGRQAVVVTAWTHLLLCTALSGPGGVGKPQPESGGGLALTLTVTNPSRVDGTLFRVTSGKMELLGVVHPGSTMAVSTFPRQRFVVFFPCHERKLAHVVPRVIADEWRLPKRPCG